MDNNIYQYLHDNLLTKKIFTYTLAICFQGKRNRRKIFDNFFELVIKSYNSNEALKNEFGNICVYFSSSACSKYYYFLKIAWNKDQESPVLFDTLLNYFKDKFALYIGGG